MGVNAVLVFGREGQHIVEARYYFHNIKSREDGLVICGELVGDTQHEFFDLSAGVVAGEGRGKSTVAGIHAGTTTFVGEAEQE
jgi:hypothetical protein